MAAAVLSPVGERVASAQVPPDQVQRMQQEHVTYRVFATQYAPNTAGSVEISVPDKCVKFAALNMPMSNCPSGYSRGLDYRVLVVLDNGNSMILPVKEVGPWNLDDNYWNLASGPRPRRLYTDLPRGKPESQAAYLEGYNKISDCKDLSNPPKSYNPPRTAGADQYGRCVLNASAVDISIPASSQFGFTGSSYVTATFLWEPSTKLSKPAVVRDGTWYFRDVLSTGGGQFNAVYGVKGDVPVMGDWNNDGIKTMGYFRPSQGLWYLRNSNTTGPADGTFRYGSPGDIPVVGDWNNDGTDTIGVFRPSEGMWYLTNRFDSGNAEGAFRYGSPGDTPVVGDWDGDGNDTLGIVRGGTWYLSNRLDTGVGQYVFGFGAASDKPLAWR